MDDLITRLAGSSRWLRTKNLQQGSSGNGSLQRSGLPFSGGRTWGSLLGNDDDGMAVAERVYEAHGAVGTLFAIVKQIGDAFAPTEWHLYRRTSVRDKKRRTEVLNHGFSLVWDRPNPFYTGSLFRETIQQHLDLVGEGIFILYEVHGVVYEMWPVRPDRMHPVKHPTKFMTGWIYKGPDGEEIPLELDNVIQIKYPNPADPYRGMGPVQTMLNDIDASRFSAEWNRNFFLNGANPGGVIEVEYRMTDPEFEAFLKRWRHQHQGVANAHRVAVLENAHWKDTKFSMSDMQFVELRNLPRELIREAFAFPKPMLGTVDDVNRANAEAGKDIMAEGQTIPRLRRWKDVINTFLLPRFANGQTLVLDFEDPTPINHEAEDRQRNSQWNSAKSGIFAGYHPDDVAEAVGLPKMRWVGIPTAAGGSGETTQEAEEVETEE
jgi:HK97 family phage portal protein